jgi:hypothetical protein
MRDRVLCQKLGNGDKVAEDGREVVHGLLLLLFLDHGDKFPNHFGIILRIVAVARRIDRLGYFATHFPNQSDRICRNANLHGSAEPIDYLVRIFQQSVQWCE